MFVLSITIWISKKHVDFCNKDAIWNGSQLEKKDKKSITNLKEFKKFMNHFKNYNNHQKSCNSGLFWKERKCVCACLRVRVRVWQLRACVSCWVPVGEDVVQRAFGNWSQRLVSAQSAHYQGSAGNEE